jgi:3-oxoacyl-[acyl-carrier protein] reductase
MDLGLKGRNAVILGGTRGIGRAIADLLAVEGANVAICARKADQVTEAVADLGKLGVKATGAAVDITDGPALTAWIDAVATELNGVDILVSNAGAMAVGNDAASWEQNFKLDVMGMVTAFEAAKPHLLRAAETHGDASFTIISSVSAAESDSAGAYGPMKAALIHQAKGLAREYAARHVRANVISPGAIYFEGGVWNMVETHMPERFKAQMERMAMGRMGTPDDIAKATVFIASPASCYTTGVNLVVDGAVSRRVNF